MSVLVQSGGHVGDRAVGVTACMMFACTDATGVPTTLGGTPAVSVYRDASTTGSTAGVTLTVDFDARTGLCHVAVDTTADAGFYSAAHDYRAVITAGTVGAVSVAGTPVGGFSLALATATLADGVAHGGAAATLQLGSTTTTPPLHVTSSGGDAVQFASSASGGNGLVATGGGGAKFVAGAGNGIGAWMVAAVGSDSSGLVATGNGTAAGFESQGGASGGHGINALGGAGGDADGLHAVGFRGGAGLMAIGGDGALADDLGNGIHAVGGFSGPCHGIYARGGRGEGSNGVVGTIHAGNATGVGFLSDPAATGFGGGGGDPWATALPGAYATGTAGHILGANLDAAVSTRSTYAGADTAGTTTLLARLTAPRAAGLDNLDVAISTRSTYAGGDTAGTATLLGRLTGDRAANLDDLDAAISTRSTYAGGAVASVTAPVAVGTVADKTGYALAAAGLDAIAVSAPTGPATTFPRMLVLLYRRFFRKATMTPTQLKTYADDGTTVVTTQTLSDTGTTQTQGDAS